MQGAKEVEAPVTASSHSRQSSPPPSLKLALEAQGVATTSELRASEIASCAKQMTAQEPHKQRAPRAAAPEGEQPEAARQEAAEARQPQQEPRPANSELNATTGRPEAASEKASDGETREAGPRGPPEPRRSISATIDGSG